MGANLRTIRPNCQTPLTISSSILESGGRMSKLVQELDPRLKVMPEARNVEFAKELVAELHVNVIAFDATDFTPEVIAVAKQGKRPGFRRSVRRGGQPGGMGRCRAAGATGIQLIIRRNCHGRPDRVGIKL